MTTSYHSYPKIYNLGHRAIEELFKGEVLVEEKIDGSQFSFGIFDGEIKCRSKGQQLIVDAPEKMFTEAVDYVKRVSSNLINGWTYRAEYLKKPKHNTLAYSRIPNNNLILFDINSSEEQYLPYEDVTLHAANLGLEVVPKLFYGRISSPQELLEFMNRESILGGQKIEGMVFKNYSRFGVDGKVLMGKHVSEVFKEANGLNWKVENPKSKDIVEHIIKEFKTEARWTKAVQHIKEDGRYTQSPKDIGILINEVKKDLLEETEITMKDMLYKWAIDNVLRGCIAGLPEWYKNQLVEKQFENEDKSIEG